MSTPKQNRRRSSAKKLDPIDWHEFANDAVLNGNMSTLYHRPANEDPTAYASTEALLEINKRVGRPVQSAVVVEVGFGADAERSSARPTVGTEAPVGLTIDAPGLSVKSADLPPTNPEVKLGPTGGSKPAVGHETTGSVQPTGSARDGTETDQSAMGAEPTVGLVGAVVEHANPQMLGSETDDTDGWAVQGPTGGRGLTAGSVATVGSIPPVGMLSTVGLATRRKAKPIRDVQDALTLAGQVLYRAMYGAPDGAKSKSCTKGYRQLAAETHLDKDTVRDLISEFKERGIVRETGTYNPDTRSAKSYEILSYRATLQMWREAGIHFVTTGRRRPVFCTMDGEPLIFKPTVGPLPAPSRGRSPEGRYRPTVGPPTAEMAGVRVAPMVQDVNVALPAGEVVLALQQITGGPVDQEAANRLIGDCCAVAADCTIEEIVEFAWSKAFLCRSGKIENPVGFLITQVPKHFQGEALRVYRERKAKELDAAARIAAIEEERRQESERELAEMEEQHRLRAEIAERHRTAQGIDLKTLLQDSGADEALQDWAMRMLKLGHRHRPRYD